MGRTAIRQLSRHLVNKIAAGEVIERPASVLKELVENALDAGAERIDIAVEDGGKKLIQVADNGCGIAPDDVLLAFAAHATSKISGEDDLFNISTMGFRGEALASISSISHAQLRTRRADDEAGWQVTAAGQDIGEPTPCPAPPGTTVTVRDLFFNTPARRKFLRTTNTEFGHITEQLARLALPHPQVAFTLRHNGREVLNLAAVASTTARVGELFTPDLAECLLPLVGRTGEVRIDGLVAPPAAARSSAKWQYIFLNGRYIRDRLLAHALREAFRGLLAPTKYPVVFLFIEIDPADVDVNVHPTKIEVRFRNSNRVYGEMLAALRETLNKFDLRPGAETASAGAFPVGPQEDQPKDTARQESMRQALADFFKSTPPPQPRLSFPEGQSIRSGGGSVAAPPTRPAGPLMPQVQPDEKISLQVHQETGVAATSPTEPAPESLPSARPLMQVHNSYIVAATDNGLMIVDQHALHERLLYNEFKHRLVDGNLTRQKMLIPRTVAVTAAEAALLEGCTELLAKLGFEVSAFGPNTVAIQQYPTILAERGVQMDAFLRELLDTLAEDESAGPEQIMDEVLAMMSCKAAIKAGDPLKPAEMEALLAAAEAAPKSSSCPHGRPTTLRMTIRDLEKQFSRT
jgi:DNA mismatch repair protein MutL